MSAVSRRRFIATSAGATAGLVIAFHVPLVGRLARAAEPAHSKAKKRRKHRRGRKVFARDSRPEASAPDIRPTAAAGVPPLPSAGMPAAAPIPAAPPRQVPQPGQLLADAVV